MNEIWEYLTFLAGLLIFIVFCQRANTGGFMVFYNQFYDLVYSGYLRLGVFSTCNNRSDLWT